MAIPRTIEGREYQKFVESPTRPDETAVEVVSDNNGIYYTLTDISTPIVTYVGEAFEQGADTSQPVWRIKRVSTNSSGSIVEYATNVDGKILFDQIWDDRDTLFPELPYTDTISTNFETNSYALIGDVPELSFDKLDPFTISTWFKLSATNERILFSKQGGSNSEGYRVAIQGGDPRFHLSGGGAGDRIEVRVNLAVAFEFDDGEWHHIAFIYNGNGLASGVSVYVDAVMQTTTNQVDNLTSSTITTVAAQISGRNGANAGFNGLENEVSVYNTNLSAAQVEEIYGLGEPRS
jgi:hypothetical protein